MEPDFAMVGHLQLPKRLLRLIETGRWPRTHEEELRQNIQPLFSKESIRSFAPDQDRIYFVRPPFSTVASRIASGETFWSKFGALEQISPEMSIIIGDFGLGSDSPIVLDYRQNAENPAVIRLKLNPIYGDPSASGRPNLLGWSNSWLRCADSFDALADLLEVSRGV